MATWFSVCGPPRRTTMKTYIHQRLKSTLVVLCSLCVVSAFVPSGSANGQQGNHKGRSRAEIQELIRRGSFQEVGSIIRTETYERDRRGFSGDLIQDVLRSCDRDLITIGRSMDGFRWSDLYPGISYPTVIDSTGADKEALVWAVDQDNLPLVKILLQYYLHRQSALDEAAICNRVEIARLLIDSGAKADGIKDAPWFPIKYATKFQSWDVMEVLLDAGAEPTIMTLVNAVKCGRTAIARRVVALGIDPTRALQFLGVDSSIAPYQLFIELGANMKQVLLTLPWTVDLSVVQFLLAHGADINPHEFGSESLLARGLQFGRLDLAKALYSRGADLNFVDGKGQTALTQAILRGDLVAVRWLLAVGAKKNVTAEPLLCLASRLPNAFIVDALLKSGCKTSDRTTEGMTPLHVALLHGNHDVALLLCGKGADLRATDGEGRSIYCYADCAGMLDIVEACEKVGATRPCLRSTPCP
ncbi:MAG: ankyrin repeat domain-containing protein [Chthonomonadales bacterium]